jgi:hypothetical protein
VILQCLDFQCKSYGTLSKIVIENSIESRLNCLGKLGQALDIIVKPLMSGISWR